MRRPTEDHRARPWRVHTLASDYELLDVWRYPIRLERDVSLATFLEFVSEVHADVRGGSSLAAALFRLRGWMGRVFGWDPKTPAAGSRAASAADLPHPAPSRPGFLGFEAVYATEDEALFRLENATVRALMHLGRVPVAGSGAAGAWEAELAVYAQARGILGRCYMALISPFRRVVVYPALLRAAERAWPGFVRRAGIA